MQIGVVAPSGPIHPEVAERVNALAAAEFADAELHFHPQCFLAHNHFAGTDEQRLDALVETANDPALDAIWLARGGYGSCRIVEAALARLLDTARQKTWLGYSDGGFLFAGLYNAGFPDVAHGPMPADIRREGGEAAIRRALAWLLSRDPTALEPGLDGRPSAAFNMVVFSQLLGTPLQPALDGHVLLLEEVSEYMYRIDRTMFHITANPAVRRVAGIRLGRCSLVPENDPPFGEDEEQVARFWCDRSGITYLGRADIGHDADNKVVPFGSSRR